MELTGAGPAPKASLGDAVIDDHPVEIKRASSTTLNQVRAVKYIPLVAFHTPTQTWYVVPAHDVVRLVSAKGRGQHTENPFESATLSINHLDSFQIPDESQLLNAVKEAITEANKYPKLSGEMSRVLAESKKLAKRSVSRVRDKLKEYNLTPNA